MTSVAQPPATSTAEVLTQAPLERADGLDLLGELHGSGYKEGAALVRRSDGQMVQLGPLQYALLECIDGERTLSDLADALCERIGRPCDEQHIAAIAQKLAERGLLGGTEHKAPPKRNPLLALRWKVLVTNPKVTRRLTAPFTVLFRPWIVAPVLAAFVGVLWFVLFDKGIASPVAQAFHKPELLLLVFGLAVASAGFHELGHAAACRYGGATPGGMGMGIYMVWPAFYTDVTDAYRLPKRDRLRVDLGGLYFNAVVAVLTMAVWLAVRADALLLLVGLQVLQMVKQLSPVIRADGYHILSDATGVPDLFSHMGPTLRRLVPWRRNEPSALSGRARVLVTGWVLIIVPILISLSLSAILLFPKIAATSWESGRHILNAIPNEASKGQAIDLMASLVRLFALVLPVLGTLLVSQRIIRTVVMKARNWSGGRPVRRVVLAIATALVLAGLAWAWWPAGQYRPVRATDNGTVLSFGKLVSAPASVARPPAEPAAAPVQLAPGRHLAVAAIPVGGATKKHPAFFVIRGGKGQKPVMIVTDHAADPGAPAGSAAPAAGTTTPTSSSGSGTSTATSTPSASSTPVKAAAFSFDLPAKPRPQDSQALAVNTKDGSTKYNIAYSLVTVRGGQPVDESNQAYAFANCNACTTVAVSFQIVLVVGQSSVIVPSNFAGALNVNCPACVTTAIADQIVVTLSSDPSPQLVKQLTDDLKQLNALPALGAGATPAQIAGSVQAIQNEIDQELKASGLMTNPPTDSATSTGTTPTPAPGTGTSTQSDGSTGTTPTGTDTGSSDTGTTGTDTGTSGTGTDTTTTQTGTPTDTTTSGTTTTGTSTSGTSTTDTTTTP